MRPRSASPFTPLLHLVLSGLLGCACVAHADVTPASLFRDHAALQQGMPIPIWGTADDGEKVTESLAGQSVSTEARDGRWSVRLDPLTARGAHVLTISGKNRIDITDAHGVPAPRAGNLVRFSLQGPGEIIATDIGDPTSVESFQAPQRKAFNGRAGVIVRSRAGHVGESILRAEPDGLIAATATFTSSLP